MDLSFLRTVYTPAAPVASLYMDVSRDREGAEQDIQARWDKAREDLASQGADAETLGAMDQVVGRGDGTAEPCGQLTFAADGRVLFDRLVADPSQDYTALWGPLPDPAPYLKRRGQHVPYVLVIVHSGGAALRAVDASGQRHTERVGPGPGSNGAQPEADAGQIVAAIDRLAVGGGAETIVLAGEPEGRERVRNRLSEGLRLLAGDVETETGPSGPEGLPLDDELQRRLDERAEEEQRTVANAFEEGRGNPDRVTEGFAPVVYALRQGRVETLVWSSGLAGGNAELWIGPYGEHLGLTEAELHDMGVAEPVRANAEAALIRAAALTSAKLAFLPQHDVEPDEGLGAVLRNAEAHR
ncbi:hypothetical protein FHX37_3237 [Haloactinospora alba]|uniref:Peptide subunit release factor 1 (ERF1) n=1 Tax=Haloactinospora alba TaxID=405555 RepID=A0A543NN30_9ACTN|nr:hypothetical protein FHX37_3237 [Haloactinospora alba]